MRDLSYRSSSDKSSSGTYGNWNSTLLQSSHGHFLSFSQISQTPKPERHSDKFPSRKRHSSFTDLIQPTVQLQRKVGDFGEKKKCDFGQELLCEEADSPKNVQLDKNLKRDIDQKEMSDSDENVHERKCLESDNRSEGLEEMKSSILTATFTPKKVRGLKAGSFISRGFYGCRRYGTRRGNIALQNIKTEQPKDILPKHKKTTSVIQWPNLCSQKVKTSATSIGKISSDKIPLKTSSDMKHLTEIENQLKTQAVPQKLVSNQKHGLIDQKKLAATTAEVRENLKKTTEQDENSTLEFDELKNQQNTSNETVDSSQVDDSKDSTYSPSKDLQESYSTEQTTIDESGEIEDNEDAENLDEDDDHEDDGQEDEEQESCEESDEEEKPCKLRAKDYLTINVPSGTLMSPKSRQKRIYEYSKVIGTRGVRFSFAGRYPDIYYNPPDVQSNMKGFSAAHTGITLPTDPDNNTVGEAPKKYAVSKEQTPVNIQNNDKDNQNMSMLERPQSSSTPKSNNKQQNISKEEKPHETPSSYSSRPTTSAEQEKTSSGKDQKQNHSDESIKENNNNEHVPDDVPEGGVNIHNESIDNDGQSFQKQSKYFNIQSRFRCSIFVTI